MILRYAICPAFPAAHLYHVTAEVAEPDPAGQCFRLPAWIPGSYLIRDFARHIVRLTALAGDHKVAVEKLDKHTWRCAPVSGRLTLAYEVYAWDLSVRGAFLDDSQGFFNGSCMFLLPLGLAHAPCEIDLLPPDGDAGREWHVATGLQPAPGTARGGFGTYRAVDYDELIDCPVLMGRFAHRRFEVCGAGHEIAIAGRVPKIDLDRLSADLARVCERQIRLFEPRAKRPPFDRYCFLVLAFGDGHGGLEHRNSTTLATRRESLPFAGMRDATEGYRGFLALASHEYFHAWNAKRIRPAAFVPQDLTRENYTRLLWLVEGFTSYYDELMLARAGLLTETQHLDALAGTMTLVQQRSGRRKQSLGDSSFDAWIKYYRQDENAPNSVVSYYRKGALVAAALDLTIRAQSQARRSLDDVMRLLWRDYRRDGSAYRGIGEGELATVVEQATGLRLARQLAAWTEGTGDIDFAPLLAPFGVRLHRRAAVTPPHFALLGCRTERSGDSCRIAQVCDGNPAQLAGLAAGDLLVALDGLRIDADNLDARLGRYAAGDPVEVLAFRNDELMRFPLRLATVAPPRIALAVDPDAGAAQTRLRRRWLHG